MENEDDDAGSHASKRRVVLTPWVYELLQEYAKYTGEKSSAIASRAVRELLTKENFWRPPSQRPSDENDKST